MLLKIRVPGVHADSQEVLRCLAKLLRAAFLV
jgi:hypothetical protein